MHEVVRVSWDRMRHGFRKRCRKMPGWRGMEKGWSCAMSPLEALRTPALRSLAEIALCRLLIIRAFPPK